MADIAPADALSTDTESDLIAAIAAQPSLRAVFVAAAEYFDRLGEHDAGLSLHNGVVPDWLVEKYQLEKFASKISGELLSCESVAWYRATSEKLKLPINKDKKRNTVFRKPLKTCPHEVLNILHDGGFVYDGANKLYVDVDNVRVENHSDVNSILCHSLAGSIEKTTRKLQGLSILLSARNASNFYHWHYDVLPVFSLIEASGISIRDIDNIILTAREASFHLPMLKILGVRNDQIKVIKPGYDYVRCERLLLATIRNNMGMRQTRKHIDWLRTKYLGAALKQANLPVLSKKIAIVRETRGYVDTRMVTAFFEERGYQVFKPENYSYEEQVVVFYNATHIVSPHGAALSLLSYCKPGTIVHEFYGEHVHPCFWALANTLGLNYYNYNCSEISQESVTNSGRGGAGRLNKSINLTADILVSLESI